MSRSRALIVRWATFVVWIMGSLGFGSGVSRYLQTAEAPRCPRLLCGVISDLIAQGRVGWLGGLLDLNDLHDLVVRGRKRGKAKNAIAVRGDQSLVEAALFGERPGAYERGPGYLRQP